jgi:hypothetical protein
MKLSEIQFGLAVQRARYFQLPLDRADLAAPGPDQEAALDRVERVLAVEEAWRAAEFTPTSPTDMPVPFDAGHGPRDGYVVGACLHAMAESEWAAGFRTCERCQAMPS